MMQNAQKQLRIRNDQTSQNDQWVSLVGIHRPPYIAPEAISTHVPHYWPLGTWFREEERARYKCIETNYVQYLLWLLAQPGRQQLALSKEAAIAKRESDLVSVNSGQWLSIGHGSLSLPVVVSLTQAQLLVSLAPSLQQDYEIHTRGDSEQLLALLYTHYRDAFDQDRQIMKVLHEGKHLYYQYHDIAHLSTAEATRPERVWQVFCEDIIGWISEGGLYIIAPVMTPYYVPWTSERKYTLIDGNNRTVSLLLYHYASHYHNAMFDDIASQVKEFIVNGYMHAKWAEQLKALLVYIAEFKRDERYQSMWSHFAWLPPLQSIQMPCLMAYEEFFPSVNVALTHHYGKVILNPAHALSLITESNTVFPPKWQSHGRISQNAAYKWHVKCQ